MKKIICAVALVVVMILSVVLVAPRASKPESYKGTIQELNKKQENVLKMTGAASAASLALGAVPGDATTPIANKVIDMAGYFVIILSVIILEKYLLTIAGYLTFTWLIPVACGLFLINLLADNRVIRHLAFKVLALGISIILIVPVSVKVTGIIEKTNEVSINTTMESVKQIQKEAEEATEEVIPEVSVEDEETGAFSALTKIHDTVENIIDTTKDRIKDTAESLTQLSEEAMKKAEDTLNDFVEVVVIMLVTTCAIPMLTLFFFIWVVKSLLGMEFDYSRQKEMKFWRKKGKKTKEVAEAE